MSTASSAIRHHSVARAALFALKRKVHQLRRALVDRRAGIRAANIRRADDGFPTILAEERSPLWTEESLSERGLQQGKVQNLRVAARRLNGVVLPAATAFSFWKQVGPPTARRGFVSGRELREGCLIPAIGGGICQLSNALYAVALAAGGEILERHAHSQVVPGSAAATGDDATVAYNYIDLRFRFPDAVRITVSLTSEELIVRLHGASPVARAATLKKRSRIELLVPAIGSCVSCGEEACFRHVLPLKVSVNRECAAMLLAAPSLEFERYVREYGESSTSLLIPLNGERWRLQRFKFSITGYADLRAATTLTLQQLLATRLSRKKSPAARRTRRREDIAALAATYNRMLRPDETHLIVDQEILPALWILGTLGGRTFDVLMRQPPLTDLHARLDEAALRWPESTTLGDYRAPVADVRAETEALAAARRIVTSHPVLQKQYSERACKISEFESKSRYEVQWHTKGRNIVYVGPTIGRKGCYELREAERALGLPVLVVGRNLEDDGFWAGLDVRQCEANEDPLADAAMVVQPSFWETRPPRLLLQALERGIPVVATEGCGLGERAGWTTVPFGDTKALAIALGHHAE